MEGEREGVMGVCGGREERGKEGGRVVFFVSPPHCSNLGLYSPTLGSPLQ